VSAVLLHTFAAAAPGLAWGRIPELGRQDAAEAGAELLLEVEINGVTAPGPRVFVRRGGRFYADVNDLSAWRIQAPQSGRLVIDGEIYAPLDALPGLEAAVDESRQVLRLTIPPELFAPTLLAAPSPTPRPSPAILTGFLNYDLALQDVRRLDAATAYLESGVSDDWGLAMNTLTVDTSRGRTEVLRLDSFFLREDPLHLTRLVVGDTLTRGAGWARPVRFGGVRFGTDFGLQPSLVTFPIPAFAGRAALPSQVELFVDDALRFQGKVDQGPFTMDRAPVMTGAGELTVVVRDILGVERRVTQSYYVSPQLLRRGLSEFSVEAGAERRAYGLRSFDYGPPFVAGSYRRGLQDWLTIESRAELGTGVQNLGLGAAAVWPRVGEFGLSAAASVGDAGDGAALRAYAARVTRSWSLSAVYERATADYRQLGVQRPSEQVREQIQLAGGLSLGRAGSLTAAHAELRSGDGVRTAVSSFNYGVTLGRRVFINGFALRTRADGQDAQTTVGVGVTVPFGVRSSAYAQVAGGDASLEYRRYPPTDQGFGYRLAVRTGQNEQQQADVTWRGQPLEATLQVARDGGRTNGRLLASGGVMALAGEVRAARRIEGGVAVVEVPGQPDVRIYQDNRAVARTGADGRALVPSLRSYEPNSLRLDMADVPLGTRLDTDTVTVTPRSYGGVIARFGLSQERSATLVVRLPDGAPLEPGVELTDGEGRQAGYSGYEGEVFVTSVREGMVLYAHRSEGPCRIREPAPPPGEVLPRIGPLTCEAVGP